ncbi:MAG: ribbon-helix-helix protein, CopG family [Solirubrobacterales bacterium]|nr:ribbon-helix-helix protein, CopG family [Solirubrobacterales bacterium]
MSAFRQPLTAFRLPPELLAELREVARASGSSASEIIREALRRYLESVKVIPR